MCLFFSFAGRFSPFLNAPHDIRNLWKHMRLRTGADKTADKCQSPEVATRGRVRRDRCSICEMPLALFFASNGSDCLERRFLRRRQIVVERMRGSQIRVKGPEAIVEFKPK